MSESNTSDDAKRKKYDTKAELLSAMNPHQI